MENISAGFDTAGSLEPNAWLQRELAGAREATRSGPLDGRRAPGWFDSSWELRRGLEVREGLPEGIELAQWLEGLPSP